MSAVSRASKRRTSTAAPATGSKAAKRRAALTVAAAAFGPAPVESHLFDLGEGLVRATVLQRPSARNKSPYVGDITLPCGRTAIAHMPSMDMGGKCIPGAECLVRTSVDKAGKPIGADALGKYGTPKCEFIMQLLKCTEPENANLPGGSEGCWVGAHPSLGEKAANALINGCEALQLEITGGEAIERVQREVTGVAGTDMRCDFLLTHRNGEQTIVEVKTVVDTDYDPKLTPEGRFKDRKCVFLGAGEPYRRAGIFPWGNSNQKGPDGEKVVSARAIKHVRELTEVAKGAKQGPKGSARIHAAVLFIVARRDAAFFRPNAEACPSFARYLKEAEAAGVKVLARRVRWGEAEGEELGVAIDDGSLPVEMPPVSVD